MKLIVNGKTAEIGGGSTSDRLPIDFVYLDCVTFQEFPIEIHVPTVLFYSKDKKPGDPITGLIMDDGGALRFVKGEYKETDSTFNNVLINVLSSESMGLSAITAPPEAFGTYILSFVRGEIENGGIISYYDWIEPPPSITSGTEDLTAGTSTLATGSIYLVYE